jgi:hypothetical protein
VPALIGPLRRDHPNMELLLKVLEQEIAVFDRPDRPDFDIIEGIIDYFRSYPARCHHPRGNLLFAKLKARDPDGAAGIIEIEARAGDRCAAPPDAVPLQRRRHRLIRRSSSSISNEPKCLRRSFRADFNRR